MVGVVASAYCGYHQTGYVSSVSKHVYVSRLILLQHEDNSAVLKKVILSSNNVHRAVFRYAVASGRLQLWKDYTVKIKNAILALGKEEGQRVAECRSRGSRQEQIAPYR